MSTWRAAGIAALLLLVATLGALAWRFLLSADRIRERLPALQASLGISEPLSPRAPEVSTPGPLRRLAEDRRGTLTRAGVIRWTNARRAEAGRQPLAGNAKLNAAAERKLTDMFARQYFAHDDPDGKGITIHVNAVGYPAVNLGENLALGNYADDAELVAAWMASPGHRENILSPRFAEIGVAVGKGVFRGQPTWLAVQVFARPRSACPAVDQKLQQRIEEQRETLARLIAEAQRLAEEGNAKIEEGNREIEEGNRIARETGGREAAEPHWQRGEQLQAEGRALLEQAREQAGQVESLRAEINANVATYNTQAQAFNACVQR